jgi:hypothetical protein
LRQKILLHVRMIKDDECDRISIEVTTERLVVWTAAGTREVTLPLTPSDTAEVLGTLIAGPGAAESSAVDDAAVALARSIEPVGDLSTG